mmetsp:Transcript_32134/g.91150  ORF Transcript_32134/g.91150 Transcript_32134/m.91150 type:complete len:1157 (-) Transcript_32134:57-3527(-)
MTQIKQISRSATVAYSPSGKYLSLGTVAAAVDLSFSTSSTLEVVKMDFSAPDKALTPFGSPVGANERFNRLTWGSTGVSDGSKAEGIIAGGLEDGSICLWDPVPIFNGTGDSSQLAMLQKHTGPVKGLMFNTFSPNLLASGASDGELCIWDLENPIEPSLYPSLKGNTQSASPEITHLSWNNKVQHILASTSGDGSTVVWDLKRQRPVIRFADQQSRSRCSSLQWNPEVATQLIVASDDDRSPTLQLWDLRNSVSPLKELTGHSKGVLSMAWNVMDPTLMLSTGKDNRTICWDMVNSSIITELPPSGNWNFDVVWSPTLPGIFTTASFDGKVNVYNILQCTGCGVTDVVNEDFTVSQVPTGPAKPLALAPKWLARPVGATFGFGGRLVSFTNGQKVDPATGTAVPCGSISSTQVVTNSGLVERSLAFEQSLAGGDKASLRNFCTHKADLGGGDLSEKETWSFLRVLFEDDARRQLLTHLGFESKLAEVAAVTSAVEEMSVAADGEGAVPAPPPAKPAGDAAGFFDELPDQGPGDGGDFFENLPATLPGASPKKAAAGDDMPPNSPGPMEPGEMEVLSALYTGNYETAVAACLQHGRMADALVLASIGGAELWKSTQKEYMARTPKPYMTVVAAVMENNLAALVRTRPLKQWRETLALLCTYARSDEWGELCSTLAGHLARNGNGEAATLCYICAGNVDEAVKRWSSSVSDASVSDDTLQTVVEKAVVLGMATGQRTASPALAELVTRYASLLAAEGRMAMALHYLDIVPGESSTTTAFLKHRIYSSGAADIPATSAIPPFPYESYDIKGQAPAAPQDPAASYGSYATPQQQQAAAYGSYGQQPAAAAATQQQQQQYQYQSYQQPAAAAASQQQQPAATASYSSYNQGYGQQPQAAAAPAAAPAAATYAQNQQGWGSYTPANQGVGAQSVTAPNPNASTGYSAAAAAPPAVPAPAVFMPQQPAPPSHGAAVVPQPSVFTPQHHSHAPAQPQAVPQPHTFVPQAPSSQRAPTPATPQAAAAAPAAAPAKPAAPPKPAGPPANITVATADTSATPAPLKPAVASLNKLFQHCSSVAPPAKKREMEDNSKRLGVLFFHLNAGDVSPSVSGKLQSLCQALDAGDLATASHIQVQMTTTDWDECSQWLTALKRLIKTAQTGR